MAPGHSYLLGESRTDATALVVPGRAHDLHQRQTRSAVLQSPMRQICRDQSEAITDLAYIAVERSTRGPHVLAAQEYMTLRQCTGCEPVMWNTEQRHGAPLLPPATVHEETKSQLSIYCTCILLDPLFAYLLKPDITRVLILILISAATGA